MGHCSDPLIHWPISICGQTDGRTGLPLLYQRLHSLLCYRADKNHAHFNGCVYIRDVVDEIVLSRVTNADQITVHWLTLSACMIPVGFSVRRIVAVGRMTFPAALTRSNYLCWKSHHSTHRYYFSTFVMSYRKSGPAFCSTEQGCRSRF